MINERNLKGQKDKLHFCTSLAPPSVIPTGSLARLLEYTTYFYTNTDLPTPDVEDYKVDNTSKAAAGHSGLGGLYHMLGGLLLQDSRVLSQFGVQLLATNFATK